VRDVREVVVIQAIGHRGDGIATTHHGPLYVPFTLPGERVAVERQAPHKADRASIVEIIVPSPERVAPVCRHFGHCGGCALQMLPLDATRSLKRDFVVAALRQRSLTPDVAPTIGVPPASRRRTALTALRASDKLMLGYHERLSHHVVDIKECPVLTPPLQARLGDIRAIAEPLVGASQPARLTVLLTAAGLDLDFKGTPSPGVLAIAKLAEIAGAHGVARLCVDGDPIVTLAEPAIDIAGITLAPPPGAFVQASVEAETAMAGLVAEHLSGAKRVADLFAGIGTFALALARQAAVRAVEANEAALAALARAVRRASGLKLVETERRDLFVDPLSPKELEKFDGVVFDPPFAGAKAQAQTLAASKVPRIAAISCNPATFARDARILVDGGYVLERAVPVDQFVYSAETEVVGLFRRDR
jgi:23S rRNA (uracil1939-C5)-methyltransferase